MKSFYYFIILLLIVSFPIQSVLGQDSEWTTQVNEKLPEVLKKHREFVSIPNVASDTENMYRNFEWVTNEFEARNFEVRLLESSTLPVFLATREVNPNAKTILYYLHLDGQPADPSNWDQEDPFIPVLKEEKEGNWAQIEWENLDKSIDLDWRIFGRAAADDKAPIMMMLTALEMVENSDISYNLKFILDPQEEAGSEAFLSTLEEYKQEYSADYLIILDGPAHPTNRPTLTFGCRGIARCSITTYGSKLPQHSGHYGNVVPNPVFSLSHLLSSMKDENGRVLIEGYYEEIDLSYETKAIMDEVPDDNLKMINDLYIHEMEKVGDSYQEAMQYPSLNVRHIETSWKGPGLKTIIPEYATAHLDIRLVEETDGARQLEKIRKHLEAQGYLVIDREPTDEERLDYAKIVTFRYNSGVNAFRTDINSEIGQLLSNSIKQEFGEEPVKIRTMGGTVPIIPAINTLGIPAIIVPMVNMDNNQHNPNENIRIGNMRDGIRMCISMLMMDI